MNRLKSLYESVIVYAGKPPKSKLLIIIAITLPNGHT